jgi:hypothetical protein
MRFSLRTLGARASLLLGAGCASEPDAIRGSDGARAAAVALTYELVTPRAAPAGTTTTVAAVDLEAWRASGDSLQELGPGGRIVYRNVEFDGPARLPLRWTVTDVALTFRGGAWYSGERSRFGVEAIAGLEGEQLELEVAGVRDRTREFGPCLGLEASGSLADRVRLFGRWREYLATFGRGLAGSIEARPEQIRIGLELAPLRRLALSGGYQWWTYRREAGGGDSELVLRLRGPFAALRLVF